jgi:hypothetical protein
MAQQSTFRPVRAERSAARATYPLWVVIKIKFFLQNPKKFSSFGPAKTYTYRVKKINTLAEILDKVAAILIL